MIYIRKSEGLRRKKIPQWKATRTWYASIISSNRLLLHRKQRAQCRIQPFYIKSKYPELIQNYHIPLDEYPRRCVNQIEKWKTQKAEIMNGGNIEHTRSIEYASHILESIITNTPYRIGGNVLNTGLITNLMKDACVEVPCLVDGHRYRADSRRRSASAMAPR